MKKQAFWKLESAVALLIFMIGFLPAGKISAKNFSAESEQFAGKSAKENKLDENFDADENEIFALVNDERQRENLNALVWDNQLAEVARKYSRQMMTENFFDHFDPRGEDVVFRVKKSNYKHWCKIGENLFSVENLKNFDRFAVENWMKSPTHRQNILDKDFDAAGIGIAESASGEVFVTQIFVRR